MASLCGDHLHRAPTRQILSADTQGQLYPMLAPDSTVAGEADSLGQVWDTSKMRNVPGFPIFTLPLTGCQDG